MKDHFVMLWGDMLASSIIEEEVHVKWAFVVCLLLCDQDGDFRATPGYLARSAGMSLEDAVDALRVLSGPDKESTSKDEEGRRLLQVGSNQWHVVNYKDYRLRAQEERRRLAARDRMRRLRDDSEHGTTGANGCEQERMDAKPYTSTSTSTSIPKKKGGVGGRFKPPTVEEVQAYINEKGLRVLAIKFCDFYESKGWMVGKNKMKDWKAACRRAQDWESMQRDYARLEGEGPQHVGSRPKGNGEWLYETYRTEDRDNHGNHSMWEAYIEEAAEFPPKGAPTFMDWLDGLGA